MSSSRQSGGAAQPSGEPTLRGRGGYRAQESNTIPAGVVEVRAAPDTPGRLVNILANFIAISPMPDRAIHQYRIEYSPDIESVSLRIRIFRAAIEGLLPRETTTFDGHSDARSTGRTEQDSLEKQVPNPDGDSPYNVTIKHVGQVNYGSMEMLRVYNMNNKKFLRSLGFFDSPKQHGGFLHPGLVDTVRDDLKMVRGFDTQVNIHKHDKLLMCLEVKHQLFQTNNVLQMMQQCRQMQGNFQENLKSLLIGKTVVVNDQKRQSYKIEDVNFNKKPTSTFSDERAGAEISYIEYYQSRYGITIQDHSQPLLQVMPQSSRRAEREGDVAREIYLVPELCNIAGLTSRQENDMRLRTDLIRTSQIPPQRRVDHMNQFLEKLRANKEVADCLQAWGYSFAPHACRIKGRVIPTEVIGVGEAASGPREKWFKVDQSGGFEQAIMRDKLAKPPELNKLAIITVASVAREGQDQGIIEKLREGFTRVGLNPTSVQRIVTPGDNSHIVSQTIKTLPPDVTAAIIIIRNQNKELYDAIKKLASTERGLVTQVVTAKLMTDDRKARGASIKIGVQLAAKIGGEPWYIDLPLTDRVMICGFDTHHDTIKRGRSFGAFLASMNHRFSRWWSSADSHDAMEELSAHLATNMSNAMKKFNELNKRFPERIFFYRDGVSDGQLEHVFKVELEETRKVIKELSKSTRLTVIIVNKRVGARFYMHQGADAQPQFVNPPPGTVIDDTVTRKNRYDFYLISQSTRNGTVSPTYYNIIYDESGLSPARHQAMAFKLCFLYYNWTGTVKVPAPCQYAHKLAYLCGEHLHNSPHGKLSDRLHFL